MEWDCCSNPIRSNVHFYERIAPIRLLINVNTTFNVAIGMLEHLRMKGKNVETFN